MKELLEKYSRKLINQGICAPDPGPLFAGLDAEVTWNRPDPKTDILEKVMEGINITAILFARPAEPYFSIINSLCARPEITAIFPEDCETRTFLHDIPVAREFSPEVILEALKRRKGLILPGIGIITFGTVSPEQAFVTYSSICFSCYVKYFCDNLSREGQKEALFYRALEMYEEHLTNLVPPNTLKEGALTDEEKVLGEMIKAGELTVTNRLVDSYFGNISYRLGDTVYISQTGSSLDELVGCIDPCPLDGSSCAGITASSEFSAHKDILHNTDNIAILHGHPKFSVILSMHCEKESCSCRQECFRKCPESRNIADIPIVPGEVGTGPYGLCHTLPPAIKGRRGVIVYGHGVFTASSRGFLDAYRNLLEIERLCFREYKARLH